MEDAVLQYRFRALVMASLLVCSPSLGNGASNGSGPPPTEAATQGDTRIEGDANRQLEGEQATPPTQGQIDNRAEQIRQSLPSVVTDEPGQNVVAASHNLAAAASNMLADPMNAFHRQQFNQSAAAGLLANERYKEALASGEYNNEGYLPLLIGAAMAASAAQNPVLNNNRRRELPTIRNTEPIQVPPPCRSAPKC